MISLFALLLVLIPFLFWYLTWFGRKLTDAQIDQYLTSINPLDKAGAYAIQEGGDKIVAEFSGSYSNVVGLPLERLRVELEAWGFQTKGASS